MAIPRRATRLFRSLRAERRTLRQGLVALVLSTVAGFVAGLTLSGIGDTLKALPGLFILIPAAVGMRGTIFGAIGARLGTTNAAGTFEVSFRREGVLYQNVYIAVVTTFASSLWLAVLAKVAASAFGQPSISLWSLVTISVVGGALGSVFILVVTVGLSVLSYRRGWDLDSVSTPMVTALGDMVDAPDPLPRDVPGAERHGRRGRVRRLRGARDLCGRARVFREHARRAPGGLGDDRRHPADADPRHPVRRPAGASADGADRGPGAAHLDPAVRLAGGCPRRDLLVAGLVQAPDRCHHAARVPGGPRGGRRLDRVRVVGRGVLADRGDRDRVWRRSPGRRPPHPGASPSRRCWPA